MLPANGMAGSFLLKNSEVLINRIELGLLLELIDWWNEIAETVYCGELLGALVHFCNQILPFRRVKELSSSRKYITDTLS